MFVSRLADARVTRTDQPFAKVQMKIRPKALTKRRRARERATTTPELARDASDESISTRTLFVTEVKIFSRILRGRERHRVYRHHVFMRRALEALRKSRSFAMRKSRFLPDDSSDVKERLKWVILRAGAETANEIRDERIDALPVALAILASLARLHFLLCNSETTLAVRDVVPKRPPRRSTDLLDDSHVESERVEFQKSKRRATGAKNGVSILDQLQEHFFKLSQR